MNVAARKVPSESQNPAEMKFHHCQEGKTSKNKQNTSKGAYKKKSLVTSRDLLHHKSNLTNDSVDPLHHESPDRAVISQVELKAPTPPLTTAHPTAAFIPSWNLRTADSFTNDARMAREVYTHLHTLPEDVKFFEELDPIQVEDIAFEASAKLAGCLTSLSTTHAAKAEEVKAVEKKCQDLEARAKAAESSIQIMEAEIAKLREVLGKKNDEIATLKEALAKKNKEALAKKNARKKENDGITKMMKEVEARVKKKAIIDEYRRSEQYYKDIKPLCLFYAKQGFKHCLKLAKARYPDGDFRGLHLFCSRPHVILPEGVDKCPSDYDSDDSSIIDDGDEAT